MTLLLAIDQSTSATKAMLLDPAMRLLDAASLPHRQHYPRAGWVEHDAEEIWRNTLGVIRKIAVRNAARMGDIACLSVTNQRETFVVLDQQSGVALCPAIVWQCRRGDAICAELHAAGAEREVSEKTGLRIDSYFSAPKMAWLLRNRPDLAESLRRGRAILATMDAFVIHRLTGGECFATDPTNASRTLLWDVRRRRWDEGLCGLFGVPIGSLPEVRDTTATFGETDVGGLLPRRTPICGVMGDSQASLLAQGCLRPGDAKATFGTGTSILLNIGGELLPPTDGIVGALAWTIGGEPTYAWEGLINYSAAILAWLKDGLGVLDSFDEIEPLAASVSDSDGVYLVPAFAGLGAPHWRPGARAAILGMSGRTTRAHVVRAALEAIALQVADAVDMLVAGGVRPRSLRADGGMTCNGLLMQMVADITRLPIGVTNQPDLSAVGAAMAGALGQGVIGSLEELAATPIDSTEFFPRGEIGPIERLRTGWRAAIARV